MHVEAGHGWPGSHRHEITLDASRGDVEEKASACAEGQTLTKSGTSALDVLGLGAFFAIDDIKVNQFSLKQSFVTLALNGGVMHKNITPRVLGNETKPSLVVEPFYFSAGHTSIPSMVKRAGAGQESFLVRIVRSYQTPDPHPLELG